MKKLLNKLKNKKKVTIVALGDSITERTFHTKGHMNWFDLLSEAIFETYGNGIYTTINSGKCGDTSERAINRLDMDVLRFNPDLVIISLGMNDAGWGKAGIKKFRKNIIEIINRIKSNNNSEILIRTPNPVVTVNGLPLPKEQLVPGNILELKTRPVKLYAKELVKIANDTKSSLVDHYSLWEKATFQKYSLVADANKLWPRMSDAIHPGYLGHLIFFRELSELFKTKKYFPWEGIL